jgi:hypothetical protein
MTATTNLRTDIIARLNSLNPQLLKFDLALLDDKILETIYSNLANFQSGYYQPGTIVRLIDRINDRQSLIKSGLIYGSYDRGLVRFDRVLWSDGSKISVKRVGTVGTLQKYI